MVGEEPYRGLIHSGWLTQLWTVGAKGFEVGEQREFKVGALDDARPVWVGYIISIAQKIQTLICRVAASASEWCVTVHSLALAATE